MMQRSTPRGHRPVRVHGVFTSEELAKVARADTLQRIREALIEHGEDAADVEFIEQIVMSTAAEYGCDDAIVSPAEGAIIDAFRANLPQPQRTYLEMYLAGRSPTQIAISLEGDADQVSKDISQVYADLRVALMTLDED